MHKPISLVTRAVALCALLILLPIALLAQGMTPEQVVSLRSVGATVLSPDGRWVAYTAALPRDTADERGGAFSELYVVAAAGGEPRAVITRPQGAASPQWSADGRTLAFATRLPAHPARQVYAVPAEGGEPRPLTSAPGGVMAFQLSPDGQSVAYTMAVQDVPATARGRDPLNDVIVASEQGRYVRLWIQPLAGGEPRVITPDTLNVADFVWSSDSRTLALQATRELGADADQMFRSIYTVPAAGGALTRLPAIPGKLGPMAFSPDSRTLAYLGATALNDPLAQSVFVMPAGGGTPRNLTPGYEGSASWVGWLDNATVLFAATEGTITALNRVPAAGGRMQRVAGGAAEIFSAVSLDARRRGFAATANTARHPNEVFVGSVGGRELRRVTNHNPWLDQVALGRQETIEWTGPEDWRIEGVVVYPVGYEAGRRYPLAVLPHGGPEGIDHDGWNTRPLYPVQVLAGRGYVVLMPNYRGSGGRGVYFTKGDHRDLGGREFDDVLAGIDHLAALGVVDAGRVGISGTSYGGYFAAWAATRHSDRFRVAIPFAGLTHWMSFMYTTDIPHEMSLVHWDLYCSDNVGLCWDRSPIAHLANARTPTLIGTGLADDRVHPEQAIELYNALRLQGVTTDLVLYPREPHGLRERAHQLDYMRRIIEWMDRYLEPGR
jgi:dipeptidyl aminopeptidase/acylaminoacyl peptidase